MTKTRVLHVDDDPNTRDLTRLVLELEAGFEIDTAPSGTAALHYIERKRPDLILLDVMMPEMDGPDLLKILRARPATADIPVIFMTGVSNPGELDRLNALDVLGIISKPFDAIALADDLKALVEDNLENAS